MDAELPKKQVKMLAVKSLNGAHFVESCGSYIVVGPEGQVLGRLEIDTDWTETSGVIDAEVVP